MISAAGNFEDWNANDVPSPTTYRWIRRSDDAETQKNKNKTRGSARYCKVTEAVA